MSKRDLEVRERRVAALARSETNICERLLALRSEIDLLAHTLDRALVPPRRPRMRASASVELELLDNLLRFPRGKK